MLSKPQERIAVYYVLLQLVIWAKSAMFFFYFGHGKVLRFSVSAFPQNILLIDSIFHTSVHVLIGMMALAFGANIEKLKAKELVVAVFAAVLLHNIGYWFTNSHPGIYYSVYDFAVDSTILLAAIIAGFYGRKFIQYSKLEK